jgi:hypothetical protein
MTCNETNPPICSTINATVKEDDSSKLTRSQDPVWLKNGIRAEYDWEYLSEERNCELAALIGIFFHIDFFFILFYFHLLGFGLRLLAETVFQFPKCFGYEVPVQNLN